MSEPAAPAKDNGRTGGLEPERGPLLHRVDVCVSLVILGICGYLYYVTTTFEKVSSLLNQDIAPDIFPVLILAIIGALSLALPLEHLFIRRRGGNIDADRGERIKPITYVTVAALVLAVFATPYLGTVLTLYAVCAALPLLWGERRIKLIVPFALLFPTAVTLVFVWILQVQLEPGVLALFAD